MIRILCKGPIAQCDLYHKIFLYYYAETKEIIYESVNLKGVACCMLHVACVQLIAIGRTSLRACSHEPGTVNYPEIMIVPGQALLRVHMMLCCPGATLPRDKFCVI